MALSGREFFNAIPRPYLYEVSLDESHLAATFRTRLGIMELSISTSRPGVALMALERVALIKDNELDNPNKIKEFKWKTLRPRCNVKTVPVGMDVSDQVQTFYAGYLQFDCLIQGRARAVVDVWSPYPIVDYVHPNRGTSLVGVMKQEYSGVFDY